MSQETVYSLLEKQNRPLSTRQIKNFLKVSQSSISRSVKCLLKHKEIFLVEKDKIKFYSIKHESN